MNEGQRLQNWRFGQKTGFLIRAAIILAISGGATLGLIYASFWASLGGSDRSGRLNASVATPTFTQALQDWRQDTIGFLIQSEPEPELDRRSVAYTVIAIAGLGAGLITFLLLERANHQLRAAQAKCDRAQQAYQQALQEKAQVEVQIQQITQQYQQALDKETDKEADQEAHIQQLESQIQAILRQSQDALAEKTEAEARIQQLERQIQEISQRHQHALDEKVKVDAHIQELSQQYQQALDKETDKEADQEAHIQQLESQIQEISQQYQHVLDKEADQEAHIQQLEQEKQNWLEYETRVQQLEQEKQTWFEYVERSQSQEHEAVQAKFNQLQAEYEQLQNEHQQLHDRIKAQETQIQAYYAQYESVTATSSEAGIVLHSTERDLYTNEKRDLVLDILSRYSPNLLENSRRQHVLQDILDTNQPSHHRTTLEEDLRRLFWDYRSMKSEIRSTLTTLGFELIEDGSHYKIIFQQDSRYQITFSKTSSDRKAGRNIFGEIRRRLL